MSVSGNVNGTGINEIEVRSGAIYRSVAVAVVVVGLRSFAAFSGQMAG